jgi:hypothetical protein
MVRWDSPLYTISWEDRIGEASHADETEEKESEKAIVRNTTLDDMWLAVTTGAKKGPTAAVAQVRQSGTLVEYRTNFNT